MTHNWFLIALIAPVLWSIVNHIDKYLLSRHFKGAGLGAIFIFSAFFSLFVSLFVWFFEHVEILNISIWGAISLLLIGMINGLAFYFYLKALNSEESSVVIPLFQMIPIFGYFLAYPILGEVLNSQQVLASLIVIFGIIILSIDFDIDNKKLSIRKNVLILVALSSFLYAFHDVLFKAFTEEASFYLSTFWQYLGLFFTGVMFFVFHKKHRVNFVNLIKNNNIKVFSLNMVSEILYVLGSLATNFATLLAPVAVVLVVSSYQPLFVFIGGTLLTVFLPAISNERITLKHLIQKLLSIVIIIIGSYLLYLAS
jgi:drug/metabolite transporter (DMT)-like permease